MLLIRRPILFFLPLILLSCSDSKKGIDTFQGEPSAVKLANEMFAAIGGKEAWCELQSLYIKAEHHEPQMTIPYQSEIWRDIQGFEVVIEQQNDSFHVKAIVNDSVGVVRYLDKRDTFRTLSNDEITSWEFDHGHNIYVILHMLGCHPEKYDVKLDSARTLSFYHNDELITTLGLDKASRPHKFSHPTSTGKVAHSVFTHWGSDDGLVHSAGGHPLDSNFVYRTEIWQPSTKSLRQTFDENIFIMTSQEEK